MKMGMRPLPRGLYYCAIEIICNRIKLEFIFGANVVFVSILFRVCPRLGVLRKLLLLFIQFMQIMEMLQVKFLSNSIP